MLVLHLFTSLLSNKALSLRQLSAKMVTLFYLISCKRVSDVHALDLGARSFTPEGVSCYISRRTKTELGLLSGILLQPSPLSSDCLQVYECCTSPLRNPRFTDLFLFFWPPHYPVSCSTITGWIRWVLSGAGIDTSVFGAHSTRGAVTALEVTGRTSGGSSANDGLITCADP